VTDRDRRRRNFAAIIELFGSGPAIDRPGGSMIAVRRFRFVAVLAASLVAQVTPSSAVSDELPPVIGGNAEAFTLGNGLEVVVIPDHRAPVVTHMVWYKVGAADEPDGHSGIAHFLEHLMFKGTANHPAGAFSRAVSEMGGDENAFTSADYTAYFQRVSRDHLKVVMDFEADRMANLALTDDVVASERKVVLEERAMRLEGEPGARLSLGVDAVLYLRHPYGVPIIGWRDEIERLDRETALAFYDRWYTPNNAILVVAGDVTAEDVRRLAEETYGRLPRRAEPPPRERPAARELDVPREVTLSDPKVTVESVRMSWLAPSYRTAPEGRAEAIDVLAEALGGSSTSLLFRDLVIERKLATSVGIGYRSDAWDDGELTAWITPREGVSLEAARDALVEGIGRAVDALDAEEIERAKARLEASTIFAQDSQQRLARIFGSALATGGSLKDVQEWPARIRAVTLDLVKSAADELDPRTAVTGWLRKAEGENRS
jgi:zinc protease